MEKSKLKEQLAEAQAELMKMARTAESLENRPASQRDAAIQERSALDAGQKNVLAKIKQLRAAIAAAE